MNEQPFRLVPVAFDEIREGDRIVITPRPGKNRWGILVDAVHIEHYGDPNGRFAVAGYQVRVAEPHHRFTNRRVLRRREALRAARLEKVVMSSRSGNM